MHTVFTNSALFQMTRQQLTLTPGIGADPDVILERHFAS